jgi:hypothetical protein
MRSSFSFSINFISFDTISTSSYPHNFLADCLSAQFKINNHVFSLSERERQKKRIQEVSLRGTFKKFHQKQFWKSCIKDGENREIRWDGFLDSRYIFLNIFSDKSYLSVFLRIYVFLKFFNEVVGVWLIDIFPLGTIPTIFITIFIIVIIIYIYKIYSIVSKIGRKRQMAFFERRCTKCGGTLDDKGTCKICGYSIVTGISGNKYLISSATYSSPSFTSIADIFWNALDSEKSINDLITKPYINLETLSDYIDWGYLQGTPDDTFKLTELGKNSVKKNRKDREV